jgi:hypothetical protein
MGPEVIVPTMFFLIVVGAPIAAWIVSRVLAHQERMAMISRGLVPPPVPPDPWTMKQAMRAAGRSGWGAAPPGPFNWAYDPGWQAWYAQRQLRKGVQIAFIGFALIVALGTVFGYRWPGPWLLFGLVPMFVGIAQVIGALLMGARIPGLGGGQGAQFGPPPGTGGTAAGGSGPAGAAAPGAPPSPGSYGGWRPDATPEIPKPPSPPDHRGL